MEASLKDGHSLGHYQDTITNEVHRDAKVQPDGRGYRIILPCDACGGDLVEAFHMVGRRLPADVVRQKIANRGWAFHGTRKATCPLHKSRREEKPMDMPAETKPKLTPVTPEAASAKAKAAKRAAISLLDDVFDLAKGEYKGGESDTTVAETVGLSAQVIKELRAEFGYVIKRPDEIDALTAELAKVRENANNELQQLAHEVSKAALAVNDRCAALQARIDALAKKFQ